MIGKDLVSQAQAALEAVRNNLTVEMEAAGYQYFSGGSYDCQWAAWVHKDYVEAVKGQLLHYSSIDEHRIAKYLGVETLPEGAIVDVTYLF